jgi:hypothetical protein
MFCSTDGGKMAHYIMAEIDVQLKKQAVMKFLVAKGEKLTCIQECLLEVYDEATVGVTTFNNG